MSNIENYTDKLLLMPIWFKAENGAVIFNGVPLSEFSVQRIKKEIVRLGDQAELGSKAFVIWMEAEHQLICAQALAKHQNRVT